MTLSKKIKIKNKKDKTTNLTEEDYKKTQKYSIIEGSFSSVSSGAGDSYVTPYALALGATNAQIGFLSSFPGLFGPISQILSSRLMEKYQRKSLVTIFVFLQAISWFLFILGGFFFLKSFYPEAIIPFLITSYIIYIIFGSMAGPPWFSMMGDVVPEKIRGKYFSKRNRINGFISIIITLSAALWLDYMEKSELIIIGFMILFGIAAFGRLMAAFYFRKHKVPDIKLEKGYYFSIFQFIKKAPFNNFGRFAIFIALINLSVNIAGPFFAVYMLKDLGLNYFWFTAINISAGLFTVIFIPIWGKFADKYGNREMLKLTSIFIPILPILWIFSPSPIYLILVPQLLSGIVWAGFNLASSNFIYDAVTVQRRGLAVSYYSLLNGIGVFLGAMIGGLVAQYGKVSFTSIFFFIFMLSGVARLIVILIMLPKIKEVRKGVSIKKNPFMYLREIKPLYGLALTRSSPISVIRVIKKKLLPTPKTKEQQDI